MTLVWSAVGMRETGTAMCRQRIVRMNFLRAFKARACELYYLQWQAILDEATTQ